MPKDERFRNFSTEFYIESCSPNFIQMIDDLHVPAFLSPLHDRDKFPAGHPHAGEFKKAHYHLLIMFPGKKSPDQVRELLKPMGAVGLEVVQAVSGMARYLCHLDNPEKAQYSITMIRCFGGADYLDVATGEADRAKAVQKIMQYIRSNDIRYYHELLNLLASDGEQDLFRYACFSCHASVNSYLRSRVEKNKNIKEGMVNPDENSRN